MHQYRLCDVAVKALCQKPLPVPLQGVGGQGDHCTKALTAKLFCITNGLNLPWCLPAEEDVTLRTNALLRLTEFFRWGFVASNEFFIGLLYRNLPKLHHLTAFRRIDMPPTKTVYQLKIALKDAKPPIWRTIQIKSTATFWELHCAIQDAFAWSNSHLHSYSRKVPDD